MMLRGKTDNEGLQITRPLGTTEELQRKKFGGNMHFTSLKSRWSTIKSKL